MSVVEIVIERPRAEVWAHVVDAETYPTWLIGAERVDAPREWPAPDSTFEHRIGGGPLRLAGSTTSQGADEPRRLHLRAGMGPLGEFDVRFDLEELGPTRTRVSMTERASGGPARWVDRVAGPLVDAAVGRRNTVSLRRLRARLT